MIFGLLLGVVLGLVLAVVIGALLVVQLRVPVRAEISRDNAKLHMSDSASAVLNADDPSRRRIIPHRTTPETLP